MGRRGIGPTQLSVLQCLRQHGFWSRRGCGWHWNGMAKTQQVLDSLVKRGLVTKDEKGVYRVAVQQEASVADPQDQGR